MKKIVLLLISLSVFANNIINYNVYKRDDRLDVMLSFDSPYESKEGDIRILRGPTYVGVVLKNVGINERNSLVLNMPFVDQLAIYPSGDDTVLEFKTTKKINVIPAVTKDDGFGLRIRVLQEQAKTKTNAIKYATTDDELDTKYILVIILMIIFIGILFYVKKKLTSTNIKTQNNPTYKAANFLNINANNVKIICEKQLDKDNKFIVLEHNNSTYKLIIGNTNIWLDAPKNTEENFEEYFEENKLKLQNMIKKNALNSYKDKLEKTKEL